MLKKVLTVFLAVTVATTSTAIAADSAAVVIQVYHPMTDAEIQRCQRNSDWARMMNECLAHPDSGACEKLEDQVTSASQRGELNEIFVKQFEGLDSTWGEYFQVVRDQVIENWESNPVGVILWASIWVIDFALMGLIPLTAAFVPVLTPLVTYAWTVFHAIGWIVSPLIIGVEGSRAFSPCERLSPDSGERRLNLCRYNLQERLEEYGNLRYKPVPLPEDFKNRSLHEKASLVHRFSCAMSEQILSQYNAVLNGIQCKAGKVKIADVEFSIESDGSLLKEGRYLRGRIVNGELELTPLYHEYPTNPGHFKEPRDTPNWDANLANIVRMGSRRIEAVKNSCQ